MHEYWMEAREHWEDMSSRRRFLVGVVTGGGALLFLGNEDARTLNFRGNDARPQIATASSSLQENYDLLTDTPLDSPTDLYRIDTQVLKENLEKANKAISSATEDDGVTGFNQDVRQSIRDVETYISFQELLVEAFTIPGSTDEDQISDTYIESVLEALDNSDPSDVLDSTPYEAEIYTDRVNEAASTLRLESIDAEFSYSPEDIVTLSQTGLQRLAELETVYQMLYAHLLFSDVDQTTIDIDRTLSQTSDLETAADNGIWDLETAKPTAYLEHLESIPDLYGGIPIGPDSADESITVADVEQSYERFADTYRLFDTSLEELSEGNHSTSSTLWTDGLEALYTARERSLFDL